MTPTPAFTPAHAGHGSRHGGPAKAFTHHPTGIAIYGAGDQWAHNNMPPFLALHFIIRFE